LSALRADSVGLPAEELRRSAAREATIAEFGRLALTRGDPDEARVEAVRILADTLEAPYAAVLELEDGEGPLRFTSTHGWPDEASRTLVPATAESHAGYTLMTDGPVLVEDFSEETRFVPHPLVGREGIRSGAGVLIRGRTGPMGVLTAHSKEPRAFTTEDVYFMRGIANMLAAALIRARTEGQLRHIADTLQRSLLPAGLPEIPGVQLAARFHPAGDGYEVGGDFYDVFGSGKRWGMVIGDVCGKGPEAAALTGLARYTLRAAAMREHRPSRLLGTLNQALLRQRGDLRYCTVAYASLARTRRGYRLRVACAGHPPPLLVRPDGSVVELCSHGTVLGVTPGVRLSESKHALDAGDRIVLYTDGVIESGRYGPDSFGQEQLEALLPALAGKTVHEVADRLESEALAAQGARAPDDIAVLVAEIGAR
jgi:phosphoserine phosphatase RsbU/P